MDKEDESYHSYKEIIQESETEYIVKPNSENQSTNIEFIC